MVRRPSSVYFFPPGGGRERPTGRLSTPGFTREELSALRERLSASRVQLGIVRLDLNGFRAEPSAQFSIRSVKFSDRSIVRAKLRGHCSPVSAVRAKPSASFLKPRR
jgi:hypothetical protein